MAKKLKENTLLMACPVFVLHVITWNRTTSLGHFVSSPNLTHLQGLVCTTDTMPLQTTAQLSLLGGALLNTCGCVVPANSLWKIKHSVFSGIKLLD